MIKYFSDDLKKFQFKDEISRDIKKILVKNNIWNPGHQRQIPTLIVVKIHLLSQSIEMLSLEIVSIEIILSK